MWENFSVWCLVLGPLKASWAILQTCQATDTEEMAAVCSVPCSQAECWLGCSAGHGLFLALWLFLENMPDPVVLDLLLFGFPFICVGLVLPTLYITVFLSQPVPRWIAKDGKLQKDESIAKKKFGQVISFQPGFHRGNGSSLCRKNCSPSNSINVFSGNNCSFGKA